MTEIYESLKAPVERNRQKTNLTFNPEDPIGVIHYVTQIQLCEAYLIFFDLILTLVIWCNSTDIHSI